MMTNNNNVPGDLDLLIPWFNIIRRVRQLSGSGSGGLRVVRVTVITDEYGNPVSPWVVPQVWNLEPRASAEEALLQVIDRLTGD